ncbi:MAG: Na-K-Cl cotransporter [Thermoanaerobaculia bacterium]|nr:Na-K-Cl cotransporter [Thermoanaerobaculia bacterium]
MSRPAAAQAAPREARLGTFLGVFTPSILTILGVILFLRTGFVVANVGLVPALAIVVIAHLITFSTALSLSAVATNMRVGAGGAYYMISRSLGLQIGGAIGIPLFLAQTFSVTLYAFGLAESLQLIWPELPLRPVAAVTIVAVAALAGRSLQLALKLQLPIMALIALALVSLMTGALSQARESLPLFQGSGELPFWTVFAVFFPAVTGIMAGLSLSGDLREPKKSLPAGTLFAVGTGFLIYLAVPIALAAAAPSEELADSMIWFRLSWVPLLVFPALWGAIFSSAVGSILGAPRTLGALIDDRVLPRLPGTVFGLSLPHLISTGVALAAVGLGDLNTVAPVLTMFFLTTYGMVNLVAGLEKISGAPSYRPTIRVPWAISLLGAAGCAWAMWLINKPAAVAAIAIELGLYLVLRRRSLSTSWGDARYGALISLARATLLKLRELPVDPRNWRPHILVFAGDVGKRTDLVRFASWLNQERGILTVCKLLVGEFEELAPKIEEETESANATLERAGLVAFAEVDVAADFEDGVVEVLQANGIAGIASNTMMMGWSEKPERRASTLRIVRRASLLGKSSLLCRIAPRRWSSSLGRIDIWWGGLQNNGDMLLLFGYLLSVNPEWSSARITIRAVTTNEMTYDQADRSLDGLLERSRIRADTEVLRMPEGRRVRELIQERSRDADLVLMGLRRPKAGEEETYAARIAELVGELPTVILVHAAGPFAGRLLESAPEAQEQKRTSPFPAGAAPSLPE